MQKLERLKPHFFTIAVFAGLGLAWLLSPLDWVEGFALFLLGSVAGDWNRQFNPNEPDTSGPIFPWDKMHSGDKLAYFLPAISLVVAGLIFLMVAIQLFSQMDTDWAGILMAIFMIGLGAATAYWKWIHRFS